MSIQDKAIKMAKEKQITTIRGHMDSIILILDGINCSKLECNDCPLFKVTCMAMVLKKKLE